MSTAKHFFTEEAADGKFSVRANNPDPAGSPVNNQAEAIHRFAFPTPTSHPEVEPLRDRSDAPDKWRPA
jgi:hypothetical protein